MSQIILALDDPDLARSEHLAKELSGVVGAFKVGATLFAAHGPEALLTIGQHGWVFCDLKLHDIPAQVGGAVEELGHRRVWMTTVHASGGEAMIASAVDAAGRAPEPMIIAAVTILTSLSAADLGISEDDVSGEVARLAELAVHAGAHAVVCSPREVGGLRRSLGPEVRLVVPGIRSGRQADGDQKRVASAAEAAMAGADFLVVGRPITQADDPVAAARRLVKEAAGDA